MKKNYKSPDMVVEEVKIDAILLNASGTEADSTKPVLSKEFDFEEDEEEEW